MVFAACTASPESTPTTTTQPPTTTTTQPPTTTTTQPPTTTTQPPTTTTTQPPTTAAATFGELAQAGQTVYSASCAACHGADGQGASASALWGADSHLAKYNTAQGLLDFIPTTMPPGAPGSLSQQDYIDILCYLLVQNNDVSASTTFDESQLDSITLN